MASAPTTLERLRVLHAVASAGTIAGAARGLDYTPSAVSQHLAALEREAGTALVERSNRGVTLTAAGERLTARASEVLDLVDEAFAEVVDSSLGHGSGRWRQPVAVAAFPTAITTMLLPLADRLEPTLRLTIVDAEAEDALAALRARRVECAITDGHAYDRRQRLDDLHRTVLFHEPLRLIARADRRVRSLADCATAPWVLGSGGSRLAAATRQACLAAGFDPLVAAETDDHHVTFEVVRATAAVALLPAMALVDTPDPVVVTGVDVGVERRVEFVTRRALRASPALALLAGALGEHEPARSV